MTAPDPARGGRSRQLREELLGDEAQAKYRAQILSSIGGWSGMAVTALPTVVFVAVDAWVDLRWGIVAAIGSAVLLGVYRLVRRQPLQQAATGIGGVVIAAVIAGATGQARDYFLYGIITSFAWGAAFLLSMLVRRPLVGLLWEFLDPIGRHHPSDADVVPAGESRAPDGAARPAAAADADTGDTAPPTQPSIAHDTPWYRHSRLLRGYQWASAAGVVVFVGRGVVQLLLYTTDHTGWLAVARVVMGYPLWAVALVFVLWIVRRTRHGLVAPRR